MTAVPIDQLREALALMRRAFAGVNAPGLAYDGLHDLILRHGTEYRPATAPPPVVPIAKACFGQAYNLATRRNARWLYVEGYGVRAGVVPFPVHHAWVTPIDNPGEAYDLAWPASPDNVYLGIAFRPEWLRKMHLASRRQYYGAIDTWWNGHPLLTGETPLEEAALL